MAGSDVKAKYIVADTTAADADGVCQSQTPAAGGVQNLTINGALASGGVATFVAARFITITSAGADGGRTFTVTGTDVNGNAQTESITGPATTTVTGTKYFRTVTQVSVDGNTAGAITVGMANNSLDVVYAGRVRVRGVYLIHTGTAGTIPFRNGGAAGTAMLTIPTPASANSTRDVVIPDEGIMFENGAYVTYTAGTTVFSNFTALYN
jgi:hypothetical protein